MQGPFCSTKNTVDGVIDVDAGSWGYCSPDCQTQDQIKKFPWHMEEKVKMNLLYDNKMSLWLKIYGNLLTYSFIIGLFFTTLLPVTGKTSPLCELSNKLNVLGF